MTRRNRALALLLASALAQLAHAMDFHRVGDTLVLSGPVDGQDLVRLRDQLALGPVKLVVLHESPGGELWNGYQVGNRIHAEGLPTAVSGKCESACALIFLAGTERSFTDGRPPAQTMVGLHGAHATDSNRLRTELAPRMAYVIRSLSGGRYPEDLLQRTVYPHRAEDMVYVFHPSFFPAGAKARGVMQCLKQRDAAFRCTMIDGLDAIGIGVVTNPQVLHLAPELRQLVDHLP